MDTIELTMDEIFEILFEYAVGDEIMTAAIEEISKPVDYESLKGYDFGICDSCGCNPCQCPMK
jgi:hypothetical protein